MAAERIDTLVIGAGISGLAYAQALGPAVDWRVLEAAPHAGGLVRTWAEQGYRGEDGPEALPGTAKEARALVQELGLGTFEVPRAAGKRFLLVGGRLLEVPNSPEELSTSTVLSFAGKLRLLAEPSRAKAEALDGSIADFTRHRLGPEALERLVDPIVAGIHAGDPEQLSLRACFPDVVRWVEEHGSLYGALKARGAAGKGGGGLPLGSLWKPAGGMQRWTDALARALGPRLACGARVETLARDGDGYRARTAGGAELHARRAVLALSLPGARALLADVAPLAAEALGSMASEGLVSIAHAYRRADVEHALDGFGLLVPKSEGGGLLGTLFASTIDPGSAPAGHVLLRSLLGGARAPALVERSEGELTELLTRALAQPLGLRAPPLFTRVTRWPAAIPRYDLAHPERQRALAAALPPGLELLGNYAQGLGLAGLVARARALAATHTARA